VGPRCGFCTACGKRCGSDNAPFKIVAVLPLDELDGEAVGQESDDAADAGSDSERHTDLRLHVR
jgi:hypothetical protein